MISPNPQVSMWRGDFGDAYTDRNLASPEILRARVALWAEILSHMISSPPKCVLEVGANRGINLRAIRMLTDARLYAVEPNSKARAFLVEDGILPASDVGDCTASELDLSNATPDFAFTSGVLIHIHPDDLLASCRGIYRCSSKWIGCIEYFSDRPEMITYRGQIDRLFKRDFGSFWLDNFPDLRVIAYGFAWKRVTGLDNLTWWLFEKR